MPTALLVVLVVLSALWAPAEPVGEQRTRAASAAAPSRFALPARGSAPVTVRGSVPAAAPGPGPAAVPVTAFDFVPAVASAPGPDRADGPWRPQPGQAAVLQQAGEQHAPGGPGSAAPVPATRRPEPGAGLPGPPAPAGTCTAAQPGALPEVRGPPTTTG